MQGDAAASIWGQIRREQQGCFAPGARVGILWEVCTAQPLRMSFELWQNFDASASIRPGLDNDLPLREANFYGNW